MTSHYELKQSVSVERLDGETIAIDFVTGHFYSFRESAADILWLITHGVSISSFDDIIRKSFKVAEDSTTLTKDVTSFIENLIGLGLIDAVPSAAVATQVETQHLSLPDDYERDEWRSPLLISNDQLADLLMIDPIHDVTEDGWPDAPKN